LTEILGTVSMYNRGCRKKS